MTGIRKAFQEIQQYGVSINVHLFKQSGSGTFQSEAARILESNIDGVVLAPFFSREAKTFTADLNSKHIPYVFIDSNLADENKLSYVGQDSFQSGTLAARLLDWMAPADSSIMVLHFAKERDNMNHLVQREKGFYHYFETLSEQMPRELITREIANPVAAESESDIRELVVNNVRVKGIFVTNSQVFYLGRVLEQLGRRDIRVIGHDLIRENVDFLKKGIVDFLICQRPEEQGYRAILALFENLVAKKEVAPENYTSIDIVTKENVDYYN